MMKTAANSGQKITTIHRGKVKVAPSPDAKISDSAGKSKSLTQALIQGGKPTYPKGTIIDGSSIPSPSQSSEITKLPNSLGLENNASDEPVDSSSLLPNHIVTNEAVIKPEVSHAIITTPAPSPVNRNSSATDRITETHWGVTDIHKLENIAACSDQMNTEYTKPKFGDDTVYCWDVKHGNNIPTGKDANTYSFAWFELDFNFNGMTFRNLNGPEQKNWYLADLLNVVLFRHSNEITTEGWKYASIGNIGYHNEKIIKELQNICENSTLNDEDKTIQYEKYIFTKDHVGRSVVRALARVGFEIKPCSLKFYNELNDYFSMPEKKDFIAGKTSLRFEIRRIKQAITF